MIELYKALMAIYDELPTIKPAPKNTHSKFFLLKKGNKFWLQEHIPLIKRGRFKARVSIRHSTLPQVEISTLSFDIGVPYGIIH